MMNERGTASVECNEERGNDERTVQSISGKNGEKWTKIIRIWRKETMRYKIAVKSFWNEKDGNR